MKVDIHSPPLSLEPGAINYQQPVLTKFELVALTILNGYMSSGRNETVINNERMDVYRASLIRAEEFLALLDKKRGE